MFFQQYYVWQQTKTTMQLTSYGIEMKYHVVDLE